MFKLNETLQKCYQTSVDALYDFGIVKMAAAHLVIGGGCHPLLLAITNLVVNTLTYGNSSKFVEVK